MKKLLAFLMTLAMLASLAVLPASAEEERVYTCLLYTSLGRQVELLLQYNKAVRHLRGGAATRKKFLEARAAEDSAAVMRQ